MVEIGKNQIITSINPETGEPIIGKNEQDTSGNMRAEDFGSVAVGNIIPAPRNRVRVEEDPNSVFKIPKRIWKEK